MTLARAAKASQQALAKALFSLAQNFPQQKQGDLDPLAEEATEDGAPLLPPLLAPVRSGLVQAVQKTGESTSIRPSLLGAPSRPVSSCQPRRKMCSPTEAQDVLATQAKVVAKQVGQSNKASWFLQPYPTEGKEMAIAQTERGEGRGACSWGGFAGHCAGWGARCAGQHRLGW